jgi:hypothetical protein
MEKKNPQKKSLITSTSTVGGAPFSYHDDHDALPTARDEGNAATEVKTGRGLKGLLPET